MAGPKIQRRLLVVFLALLGAVVGPAAILLERWVGADAREQVRESLTREARVLASELVRSPPADVPAWIERLRQAAHARVTVIAPDGRVLGDSEVPLAQLSQLDSHSSRPEVAAARVSGLGTAVRRSATLDRDMMYVAVAVKAPAGAVLRLALPLDQVAQTVASAQSAVFMAGLVALGLGLVLGVVGARSLSRPISAMTRAAKAMAQGDFSVPLPARRGDELGELVQSLESLRTELAARLEELRAEGSKLRTILNGMSEGIALVQDGAITVANPAFTALLGIAPGIEGRTPLEAVRLPELAEVLSATLTHRQSTTREVQRAGRMLRLQAQPLGEAPLKQAVVMLSDMTEAKRLERLRRDFVANASHELRTPVAAIVGAAETLAGGASEDPDARRSFIGILMRHAERLSRLTADLLEMARLEAGYRPRTEVVSLRPVVQAVLSALQSRATDKRIRLVAATTGDLAVRAEPAAVDQILTNLIDNAIKYTPDGGSVEIGAEARGSRVELCVADTGPGIPEEHLQRLFERFYRVDTARSRELGGTGLGLAIVKHLALANAGDVRVESQVGRGSRFFVSLPGV